jgi:rfaE bifunctional protein kinase chain/domain/rfaE bifunctional protein nucleotidyltransferase chain/domain
LIRQIPELDFSRKIKTREQLIAAIGPRPRPKKVIMCHGTFDLVHPGHVRHLLYAKTKADLLVASLTSDAHIMKGNYRPYVPQDLRAMNLAALEAVDFVVIDNDPTPLANIRAIQPDYFAKGYEYTDGQVPLRTREEMAVLAEYGGEILFTPGDIVFSSSKFIETTPPNIANDKLHTLMESEGVTFDDLRAAVRSFQGTPVHVLGDTIIDSYVYCQPISSGSAKSPTLAVSFESQIDYAGGAAVVAKHLRAAGANVSFSTLLGDDAWKDFLLRDMEEWGIDCRPVIDSTRCTTNKNVYIAKNHRLLKFDRVDNRPIQGKTLESFSGAIADCNADVFVFSDFHHGIFHRNSISKLTAAIPAGRMRVADSQVASRWGNILEFQGFDLITPNEREARFALGDQDSVIRPLALDLYNKANCKTLILKLGDRGTITYRENSPQVRAFFTLDSFAKTVVDPVGAGDALLAYATLALARKYSPVVGSIIGSIAAGQACAADGNCPVEPEGILERIDQLEKEVQYA